MKQYCIFAIHVTLVALTMAQQRVAPGVPPQHYQGQQQQYQQPPQQQQYQQAPQQQQYQQQQQQQQQQFQQTQPQLQQQQFQQPQQAQPAQQQQQYQPQQQQQFQQHAQPNAQPNAHGHDHGHAHGAPQQILSGNVQEERAHIQEHLDVPIDTSKMSEQELQFHYFKMHDNDNNNKLDGSELIKSLIHWHEQGSKENQHNPQQPHIEEKVFTDDELVGLIDPILKMDDTNNDGYIDYPEFIRAQQKAAGNAQQQQQQQPQQQPPQQQQQQQQQQQPRH